MRRALLTAAFLVITSGIVSAQTKGVDYSRDVRPILAGKCFQCHGPDDKVRKADLRLDARDTALKVLAPGEAAKSDLLKRITHSDPTKRMPPAKMGKGLADSEIATLKRWVEQGAPYAQHWAYVKSVRPPLPTVKDAKWQITPIDRFVLARLEREGLRPNGPADPYTLIRRLSIDLTGLPPTIPETDEFVKEYAAKPQAAYEALVDQLLAKKSYGERWAAPWLDLARYADSQGFANDPDRTIWRYRDWVIEALNSNLSFDQFTIQQLAGDLLPNPTTSQLVATGFHRNTLTNTEGGTNPEEFRSAAVVDRVNTTFSVWLGTTMACAQCHTHKYDPFSQKEFFQVYAILNNCEDANAGNDSPTIPVAAVGQEAKFAELSKNLAEARKELDAETRKVDAKQADWEKSVKPESLPKEVVEVLKKPAKDRKPPEAQKLQAHHRGLHESWKKLDGEVKLLDGMVKNISTTAPILKEGKPRETHIQLRGNFLDLGEKVAPGLPAALPGVPDAKIDRLTLAKWIVSPENPLTARVAVNRLWEELFGIGLVETSEDFGTQGEPPSHPELLDWLATEYVRLGWDTKALLKLIVTSAAYRQSSGVRNAEFGVRNDNPQSAIRNLTLEDPMNRLLSRGPRVRLSAEAVRDQALAVGGLLSPKMYGPPVQPPRPNFGLSAAFGGSTDWQPSPGEDKYRRALYTKVRRNAPYPSLTTFDAPERTYCNVRRLRTNTPLQALVTLNDPVYVEAAQALGRRVLKEGGGTDIAKITFAFRLVLTRPPTTEELQRLSNLLEKSRTKFKVNPAQATALATKPLGPLPQGTDAVEAAAWTVLGNVLLNLDETLAKR
jgi:mono/diheme cytochrome c family protein